MRHVTVTNRGVTLIMRTRIGVYILRVTGEHVLCFYNNLNVALRHYTHHHHITTRSINAARKRTSHYGSTTILVFDIATLHNRFGVLHTITD